MRPRYNAHTGLSFEYAIGIYISIHGALVPNAANQAVNMPRPLSATEVIMIKFGVFAMHDDMLRTYNTIALDS